MNAVEKIHATVTKRHRSARRSLAFSRVMLVVNAVCAIWNVIALFTPLTHSWLSALAAGLNVLAVAVLAKFTIPIQLDAVGRTAQAVRDCADVLAQQRADEFVQGQRDLWREFQRLDEPGLARLQQEIVQSLKGEDQ